MKLIEDVATGQKRFDVSGTATRRGAGSAVCAGSSQVLRKMPFDDHQPIETTVHTRRRACVRAGIRLAPQLLQRVLCIDVEPMNDRDLTLVVPSLQSVLVLHSAPCGHAPCRVLPGKPLSTLARAPHSRPAAGNVHTHHDRTRCKTTQEIDR